MQWRLDWFYPVVKRSPREVWMDHQYRPWWVIITQWTQSSLLCHGLSSIPRGSLSCILNLVCEHSNQRCPKVRTVSLFSENVVLLQGIIWKENALKFFSDRQQEIYPLNILLSVQYSIVIYRYVVHQISTTYSSCITEILYIDYQLPSLPSPQPLAVTILFFYETDYFRYLI